MCFKKSLYFLRKVRKRKAIDILTEFDIKNLSEDIEDTIDVHKSKGQRKAAFICFYAYFENDAKLLGF